MSTMTPAEFASELGTDGRTVRKFLRSITPKDEQPGKGSRWALPATKREVAKLTKQYREWAAAEATAKAERAAKAAEDAKVATEVEDDPEQID